MRPSILPFFFSILVQAMCWVNLVAQSPIQDYQQLSFGAGLSDRLVRDITIDSKGIAWFATQNGLNQYLGHRIQVFDNSASPPFQIHENRINQCVEIEDQQLVLLNSRNEQFVEIIQLDNLDDRLLQLNPDQGITGNVEAVTPVHLGKLYVLTSSKKGFEIFERQEDDFFISLGTFLFPGFKETGDIRFIKGKNNQFWILDSENGLIQYNPTAASFRIYSKSEINGLTAPSSSSYSTAILHEDQTGLMWVAFPFRRGLLNIDKTSGNLAQAKGFPREELYNNLWEDKRGNLLISTFQAFGKLNKLFQRTPTGDIKDAQWILDIDRKINSICGDDFNRFLFLGTHVGVYKVTLRKDAVNWILTDQKRQEGDWDDGISIRSVSGDQKGNIYIGRELKSWYRFAVENRQLDSLEVNDAAGFPVRLWCNSNVLYDPAGFLWGGSCAEDRGGLLHRLNLATGVATTFPIANKVVQHIVRMKNGELLLASGAEDGEGLLYFFNPSSEQFTPYYDAEGNNPLADKKPQYAMISKDGKIWIGTDEGLVQIDRASKRSTLYTRSNSQLNNDNILVIHEATDGKFWIGTHSGINIFDRSTGEVEVFNKDHGLCNNIVCGILPDEEGNYFISTFNGLSYLNTAERLASNFYLEHGFSFNEFNRLAFHKDTAGTYYFGTLNGVNYFKKEDLLDKTSDQVNLSLLAVSVVDNKGSAQVYQTDFEELAPLQMRNQDDYLKLEFTLSDYQDPQKNQYAVKLEGLDKDWRILDNRPYLELNKPLPGEYKIRIKAAPAMGTWLKEEIVIPLSVKQAFYQNPWFQIALPLAILFFSYFISNWYIQRIKSQEEKQTKVNKKFAEMELQALQSQMNPHFVFNALGAIQYYIKKNDAAIADNYLAKFAKLMRLFLESSKNKYISLAEEIKLLSLYVELERMRFENKFDFKLNVEETIDIHSREIPAVMIQPFVENAINHGLFHKEGEGQLYINFTENSIGDLICTIKDTGIGREKANALKQHSRKTHKSRGMQIVNERLEVLRQMEEVNISIKIEDLHPAQEDTGTVVKITLPDID